MTRHPPRALLALALLLLPACGARQTVPGTFVGVEHLSPGEREALGNELARVLEGGSPLRIGAPPLPEPRNVDEGTAKAVLVRLGMPIVPRVFGLLDNTSSRVRLDAIEILRRIGDSWDGGALLRVAQTDPDPAVANQALFVLAEFDDDRVVPLLQKALAADYDENRSPAVVEAARTMARRELVPSLLSALELWPPGAEPPLLLALKEITNHSFDEANWPPAKLRIAKTDRPRLVRRWQEWWKENAGRSMLDWAVSGIDEDIEGLLHWRAGSADFVDTNLQRYVGGRFLRDAHPGLLWEDSQRLHDEWNAWWKENYEKFDLVAAQMARLRRGVAEACDAARLVARYGDPRPIPVLLEAVQDHGFEPVARPEVLALIVAVRRLSAQRFEFPLAGERAPKVAAMEQMYRWKTAIDRLPPK
ncbi:MAG: HEAT repeat domain-containing protein [Planctomycetes bacterium]|nr:HEAT repeat domain-containing protein [Planctomycetota bacterium]